MWRDTKNRSYWIRTHIYTIVFFFNFRFQAYTSIRGSVPELKENRELAVLMNTIVLHTKLVDQQEDVICDVADLSILWWEHAVASDFLDNNRIQYPAFYCLYVTRVF